MDREDRFDRSFSGSPFLGKKVTWKEPVEQPGAEYMAKARDLERELRALTIEKARSEAMLEDLQVRLDRQEESSARLREENSKLNHDLDQLINVISTARATGKWDIENVRFRELTPEQVFGSMHEQLTQMRNSEDLLEDHVQELREQLRMKDEVVGQLQQKVELMKIQHGEQVISREEHIQRLQLNIHDLQDEISKKEGALQKMEVDLIHAEEDRHKTGDSLSRREITLQQQEHELTQIKQQYREAVEENGRLEARIQAFAINAQSEQDVLNTEKITVNNVVCKRIFKKKAN